MRYVLGIDPGKSGGISCFKNGKLLFVSKMPKNLLEFGDLLHEALPLEADLENDTVAYLEKVHAMPRQGVTSCFTFGEGYGILQANLVNFSIPIVYITPRNWMKELDCMTGGDKNVTKNKAIKLFPKVKVTHAIADALLIGYYGSKQEGHL
jgi:crossover junction endodeoxyribonuclease RuvC